MPPMQRVAGLSFATALASACMGAAAIGGCASPRLAQDGQLVFQQAGARGATMMTAHGLQFIDRNDVPQAVVRKSVNEPWKPATGFLLPADGVWRKTSTPTPLQGNGLLVLIRPSDVLIPSWGGEILVRIDAIAPAAAFPKAEPSIRPPVEVVIVIDGAAENTGALADVAIDDAGERDRVAVVESGRGRAVMPPVPGSNRSLLHAAVEKVIEQNAKLDVNARRSFARAMQTARGWLNASRGIQDRRIVIITDGVGVTQDVAHASAEAEAATKAGFHVYGVAAPNGLDPKTLAPLGKDILTSGSVDERADAVAIAMPPPGEAVLGGVELEFSSVPAPARVIETSGGDASAQLDRDLLWLGDMVAGEARTEIARIALPQWVPGEPMDLTVIAHYKDLATKQALTSRGVVRARYSVDVEKIAESRHGDVIAYASALAMVRKLQRSFLGSNADKLGGLRPIVLLQATSMSRLAASRKDPALASQAEVLSTLLGVVDD
jgi:hypothetical protein